MGEVTIYVYLLRLTSFYFFKLLKCSFYTYIYHQNIIKNALGLLKVIVFLVMQLKSYKIEIVHFRGYGVVIKKYIFFVKIAQILH